MNRPDQEIPTVANRDWFIYGGELRHDREVSHFPHEIFLEIICHITKTSTQIPLTFHVGVLHGRGALPVVGHFPVRYVTSSPVCAEHGVITNQG